MKLSKIILTGMVFILALSFCISAQDNSKTGKLDLSELTFDFGLVPRDAKVIHDFKFENTGNDVLKILEIKPSCGCTTAPIGKKVLEVGDTTSMFVTYKTGIRSGASTKLIKVTTDQKDRGRYDLKIKAWVETPTMITPKLTASPRSMEFKPKENSRAGKAYVELSNNDSLVQTINIVDYTERLGKPSIEKETLNPGETTKLYFEFYDNETPFVANGSVTLDVMSGEDQEFKYTVPVMRTFPAPGK